MSIRTVAVGTLWSPGALVLHTAPATQQAPICDAGTAVSEVGALLHWETVDLKGEGGDGRELEKERCEWKVLEEYRSMYRLHVAEFRIHFYTYFIFSECIDIV